MESACSEQAIASRPDIIPLPLTREKVSEHLAHKYKIGYYASDKHIEPVGAVKRAVLAAAKKLEALGHTLIPL